MINDKNIEKAVESLVKDNNAKDQESSIKFFAAGLSQIIADAIRSATVTVNAGIPVATAGSAVSQTGATTGTGTGKLS